MALLVLSVFVIDRLTVNLEETIELDDFALSDEVGSRLFAISCWCNLYSGLLYLCISHLTGDGTLPDEVIELTLLSGTLNLRTLHIGRTDGFVRLLSTL